MIQEKLKYKIVLMQAPGEKEDSEDSSLFILENLGLEPIQISEMKRSVNPINDLKAYFRIKKIIREFKPDIVHTHAAKSGALGRLAAYHCNVPIIIHTFHGHVFHSYFSNSSLSLSIFIKYLPFLRLVILTSTSLPLLTNVPSNA